MTTNTDLNTYNSEIENVTTMIQNKLNNLQITEETTKITIDLRLTVKNEKIQFLTDADCIVKVESESKPERPVTPTPNVDNTEYKTALKDMTLGTAKDAWTKETQKEDNNNKNVNVSNPENEDDYDDEYDDVEPFSTNVESDRGFQGGNTSTLLLIPRTKIVSKSIDDTMKTFLSDIEPIIENMIAWYIDNFKYRIFITLNGKQTVNGFEIDTYDITANYSDFAVLQYIMGHDYNTKTKNLDDTTVPTPFNDAYENIKSDDTKQILLRVFSDKKMYGIYTDTITEKKTKYMQSKSKQKKQQVLKNILKKIEEDDVDDAVTILYHLAKKLNETYIRMHASMSKTNTSLAK